MTFPLLFLKRGKKYQQINSDEDLPLCAIKLNADITKKE